MRPEASDAMRTLRDHILSRRINAAYFFLATHSKLIAEVMDRAVSKVYPMKMAQTEAGLLGHLMREAATIPKRDIYGFMRDSQIRRFFGQHGAINVPVSVGGTRLLLQMLGKDLISITQTKDKDKGGDQASITLLVDDDVPVYSKFTRKGRSYRPSRLGYGKIKDAFYLAFDALERASGDVELLYKAVGERGFCAICGHGLTDPLSRARGIGPECVKTFGSVYAEIRLAKEREEAMRKNPSGVFG